MITAARMSVKGNAGAGGRRQAPDVTGEITRQLVELKTQLNKDIIEDLATMKEQLAGELMASIRGQLAADVAGAVRVAVKDVRSEILAECDKKIAQAVTTMAAANDKQLAVVRTGTREMVTAVGQEICSVVYDRVMDDIERNIVPKVDNMVQWVNYNMQDGGEIITSYRRAVERQVQEDSGRGLITDGKKDSRYISEHVRTFFGDDD